MIHQPLATLLLFIADATAGKVPQNSDQFGIGSIVTVIGAISGLIVAITGLIRALKRHPHGSTAGQSNSARKPMTLSRRRITISAVGAALALAGLSIIWVVSPRRLSIEISDYQITRQEYDNDQVVRVAIAAKASNQTAFSVLYGPEMGFHTRPNGVFIRASEIIPIQKTLPVDLPFIWNEMTISTDLSSCGNDLVKPESSFRVYRREEINKYIHAPPFTIVSLVIGKIAIDVKGTFKLKRRWNW